MGIKYQDILNERTKIHQNKGISIFYNDFIDHDLQSRLNRANISKKDLTIRLNNVTTKLKSMESGEYGFEFPNFKMPIKWNKEKKEILIKTILTKSMKMKDRDIFVHEGVEYIVIEMEE